MAVLGIVFSPKFQNVFLSQRTNGPVNAHLRSVVYSNKHTCFNIMENSPSKGADEVLGPFFHNNQYPDHLPISCKSFPSTDILRVLPIQRHRRPMLTLL